MRKQIAHEAITISFIHSQTRLLLRPKDAWRQSVGKCRNIRLVGRGQLNETSEVGADGVQGSNVGKAELAKSGLDDGNTSFLGSVSGRGAVDCLYDFVDVGGDEGV